MRLGGRQADHHLATRGLRTRNPLPRNPREAPHPTGAERAARAASQSGRKNKRNVRAHFIFSPRLLFFGTDRRHTGRLSLSATSASEFTCSIVTSAVSRSTLHQFRGPTRATPNPIPPHLSLRTFLSDGVSTAPPVRLGLETVICRGV